MLELQKKYANNREKYAQEVQKLYDEEGVSPLSGCLPMLLTLPIMMGLYYVVAQPLRYFMGLSTEEIAKMAELLNIEGQSTIQMQLRWSPSILIISTCSASTLTADEGGFQFPGYQSGFDPLFQGIQHFVDRPHSVGRHCFFAKLCHAPDAEASGSGAGCIGQCFAAMMNVMMPAMSIYFGFILPAGLGVYWISRNIFSVIQELILTPYFIKKGREKEAQMIAEQGREKEAPSGTDGPAAAGTEPAGQIGQGKGQAVRKDQGNKGRIPGRRASLKCTEGV